MQTMRHGHPPGTPLVNMGTEGRRSLAAIKKEKKMTDKTPIINIHKGIPEKLAKIKSIANRLKNELDTEEQAIVLPLLRKEWKSEKNVLDFTAEVIEILGNRKVPSHLALDFDTQISDAIANEETPEEFLDSVFLSVLTVNIESSS